MDMQLAGKSVLVTGASQGRGAGACVCPGRKPSGTCYTVAGKKLGPLRASISFDVR